MGNKVYFISDAHLVDDDDSRRREIALCHLLDEVKAADATLVLLGDIFDFWFSYRHVVPRGHTRLLGKLAELSDHGTEIHYFIGNHDMWVFDYLEKEMKVVMHDKPAIMEFDGKRFLVGHGDGLGHLDRHYDFLKRVFRSRTNQWLFAILPEWMTFGIALRWSRNSLKHHDPADLCYLGDEREGIVLHCKEVMKKENLDYCVFGHRHTPVTRDIAVNDGGGVRQTAHYVNVGDWREHRTYALYDGEQVKLIDLGKD